MALEVVKDGKVSFLVDRNRTLDIQKEATVYICKGCGLTHVLKPKYPAHSIKGEMCGIWESIEDN